MELIKQCKTIAEGSVNADYVCLHIIVWLQSIFETYILQMMFTFFNSY